MASSSNGNGNLMDEFEEAFQACLHALTKQESNTGVAKDEIELEVQHTANKFIDVARQMEAFFLQKRFLISTLKPEMLLKDENQELKLEIQRKDILINKHYTRLEEWKTLLSDTQLQSYSKTISSQPDTRSVSNCTTLSGAPSSSGCAMGFIGQGINSQMQTHPQLQVQQQQMLQQQQQMNQIQQMQVNAQQMYMHQAPTAITGRSATFNQNGNILQGPLAYLEKTTSSIDIAGMGDGRR